MPSAEHRTIVNAPFEKVWGFARDMNNWAPLVTGYQSHEELSGSESIWHLKGELGGMTRVAQFKVHIDDWDDSGQVRFSLQGINEPVKGNGVFEARALPDADGSPGDPGHAVPIVKRSWLGRLIDRLSKVLLHKLFGHSPPAAAPAAGDAATGRAATEMLFALTLEAGGAAGMVLNMLLNPLMKPVAEDLAIKIKAAIES